MTLVFWVKQGMGYRKMRCVWRRPALDMLKHLWDLPMEVPQAVNHIVGAQEGDLCNRCISQPKEQSRTWYMLAYLGDLERELGEEPEEIQF